MVSDELVRETERLYDMIKSQRDHREQQMRQRRINKLIMINQTGASHLQSENAKNGMEAAGTQSNEY